MEIFSRLRRKREVSEDPGPGTEGDPRSPSSVPASRPTKPEISVSRPKPRRKPYTGNRLKIYIPGRLESGGGHIAAVLPGPPPATPPDPADTVPVPATCPSCGARVPPESGLCGRCTALALDALRDVELLCERAAATARRQDSDHDKAGEILSKCESAIASAILSGGDTAAAQQSLERAAAMFRRGDYAAAAEHACAIPETIRNEGVPGSGDRVPGHDDETPRNPAPGTRPPAPAVVAPAPGTRHPTPETLYDSGNPARPARCPVCGEPLEPDWKACPNCSALIEEGLPVSFCRSCGRELLPKWRICPFCDADIPQNAETESREKGRCPARPPRSQMPEIPPHLRERDLLEQIQQIKRLLDEASAKGRDVTKGRNLLELAVSFTRSRNYDKGDRYVRKARNVAETMLSF